MYTFYKIISYIVVLVENHTDHDHDRGWDLTLWDSRDVSVIPIASMWVSEKSDKWKKKHIDFIVTSPPVAYILKSECQLFMPFFT